MNNKPQTKKIKITSRGIVTTSRGRCRTPIATPYVENINTIFNMLTRDNAKVVEILPNGKEVELTIYNFSKNNAIVETPVVKAPPVHVGYPAIVNAGVKPEEIKNERPLTRKERRELERKARAEAEANKVETPVELKETEEVATEVIEKESAIVEEEAISE